MITICDNSRCTGCSTCIQKCPNLCISWKMDGFWNYPKIDNEKCVECKICQKSCQANYEKPFKPNDHLIQPQIYAALINDLEIRKKSTSGGAFYAIAEKFLEDGGYVYGATMDKFRVFHTRVDNIKELSKLQGSKYIQSDLKDSYKRVKIDLESGKKVLFSGTSCQIEGLYRYLGEKNEQLLTCDLLCKGVPPQRLFDKYIQFLQKRYNGKIESFNFRDKALGYFWLSTIELDSKKVMLHGLEDTFVKTVGAGYVREACFSCKFTSEDRVGDFSLADFWHIGEKEPIDTDISNGCSLILVNTVTAEKFLKSLSNSYIEKRTIDEARRSQSSALSHPNRRPNDYNEFFKDAEDMKWEKLSKKYLLSKRPLERIREALPKKVERTIVGILKKK